MDGKYLIPMTIRVQIPTLPISGGVSLRLPGGVSINSLATALLGGVTSADKADFLCCPGFAFMLSLRNQQPLFAKEMVSILQTPALATAICSALVGI